MNQYNQYAEVQNRHVPTGTVGDARKRIEKERVPPTFPAIESTDELIARTRKETLQAVAEWLKKPCLDVQDKQRGACPTCVGWLYEAAKRGSMPDA